MSEPKITHTPSKPVTHTPGRAAIAQDRERMAQGEAAQPGSVGEPVGFMSEKQLALIDDPEGEHGRYIPMRKTPEGNFTFALYAAAPTEAKPAQQDAVDAEQIKSGLNRAFSMGQNYWADADSESYKANKRGDAIRQKFIEMRDELCAAISAKKGGAA